VTNPDVLIPGDFVCLHAFLLKSIDHFIGTIGGSLELGGVVLRAARKSSFVSDVELLPITAR
jgi:hypothetical protein